MTVVRFLKSLSAAALALAAVVSMPAAAQSTMVRLHTTEGPIDFKLLDAQAPRATANFLAYVRDGSYLDTLVHRSAKKGNPAVEPFVIQGGGFRWPATATSPSNVPARAPLQNEFGADRSNVRGTVAMARLGQQPNSATNQWFVNLSDNTFLDTTDGVGNGFTVFARVTAPGMVVADRIGNLPRVDASSINSAFSEMPVASMPVTPATLRSKSVLVTQVTEFPPLAQQSDADRVFNYLEALYPQYLSPSQGQTGTGLGYTFRYYSGSNAYLGVKEGKLYFLVPAISNDIVELAPVADLLGLAAPAGY